MSITKSTNYKIIDGNSILQITKNTNESILQFTKRIEVFLKYVASGENLTEHDDDMATMLSTAYTNKLKYNLTYNGKLETLLTKF